MDIQVITVPYRYDEHLQGAGRGPDALLAAGLMDALAGGGRTVQLAGAAFLDPAEREQGRRAVNIGKLGASTAQLVAAVRAAGYLDAEEVGHVHRPGDPGGDEGEELPGPDEDHGRGDLCPCG